MRTHLGLALIFLMAACGGDDDDDSDGTQIDSGSDMDAAALDAATQDGGTDQVDGSSDGYAVQLIVPACLPEPAPRPAIHVLLGAAPENGESCTVESLLEHVVLEVWTRDIEPPVTFSFGAPEASGRATFCPGGTAPCREGEGGSITFDTYEATVGASGSWEFTTGSDERSGRFDATWCDPDPLPDCVL